MGSGDRITDVLSVVTETQRTREKSRERIPIHRLRIGAVYAVAERELRRGGRFKDKRSAKNTIDDALARRLGVRGLGAFDSLLDDWFRYGSKELERAALQRCLSEDQRARARAVFQRGPGKYVIESDGRLWVLRRFGPLWDAGLGGERRLGSRAGVREASGLRAVLVPRHRRDTRGMAARRASRASGSRRSLASSTLDRRADPLSRTMNKLFV